MKILVGPSDEETYTELSNLTADKIFVKIRNLDLDERYFQLAVDKGLLVGLSSEEVLIKAAEGGSLKFVESAHIQLIKMKNDHIIDIINQAACKASRYGHLQIIKYLYNFGADINLILLNSGSHSNIAEFAFELSANINAKLLDSNTGESHSILWFMLDEVHRDIKNYILTDNN